MKFLTQYLELWKRLKPRQRVAVVVALAATLGLAGSLIYYGSQPNYAVLFADLKPTDAQAIVEKLKSANVPYTLSGGGTTINVPQERVTELRLQMAGAGVLSGGHVGFDIFDRTNFGATDFAQQVNYQRAIEGELARTLEGMDEVESARVHVTRPRESLFADKAERAKASIVLRVRQGRELSRERTEAVTSLVASAVEGLDPADVSLMDARGRLLSAPSRGGDGSGAFANHLEARRKFESEMAERVVTLLEPVTGAGRVRADVAADMDFSQIEQTEEKYNPQSSVIRSQQTSQETRSNPGVLGGISGTRANDPATAAAPTPAPNATPAAGGAAATTTTATAAAAAVAQPAGDQRTTATTNYEIDKTVKRTLSGAGGRLTRLSVSVVVDHKAATADAPAVARTPEELKKMQDIVAAAVGVDANRGDQIVVQSIPFDQQTVEMTPQTWLDRYRDLVQTAVKYGALALAALIIALFIVRPARRALRLAGQTVNGPALLPAAAGAVPAFATPLPLSAALAQVDGNNIDAAALQAPDATNDPMMLPAAPADGVAANAAMLPGTTPAAQAALLAAANSGGRTVAEIEAQMEADIAREMAEAGPKAKRASVIKKQIVEKTQNEAEMVAMTIRGWLQDGR